MQISRELARELSGGLAAELNRVEVWMPWALRGVRVIVILGLAWGVGRVSRRLLGSLRGYAMRAMDRRGDSSNLELEKRAATIITVLAKLVSTLIWIVAIVMALNELTFNVQPLLAGLGVAGLALGLGAQTIIKDWLGGFFMLIEDQVRMGDSVTVNGVSGSVEEINLRTTVLRAENGALHVIPNGSITALANLTREYSYYVFETTLGHGADVNRALTILEESGAEILAHPEFQRLILAPLELMGVDRLSERGPVIRARIKTLPSKQAIIGRELNRRVKERLDAERVAFPPVVT